MDINTLKLTKVLITLTDLTDQANNSLDDDTTDRQLIAEHLITEIRRLVDDNCPLTRSA